MVEAGPPLPEENAGMRRRRRAGETTVAAAVALRAGPNSRD